MKNELKEKIETMSKARYGGGIIQELERKAYIHGVNDGLTLSGVKWKRIPNDENMIDFFFYVEGEIAPFNPNLWTGKELLERDYTHYIPTSELISLPKED